MDVELRQLHAFEVVADELHFGRAASRLHLSQPALSRQIRSLEQRLGTPLLVRGPRHVALTEAGRVLRRDARRLLTERDRAIERTQRAGRGEIGHLSIGLLGSAVETVATSILQAVRKHHSGITFTLTERPWVDQTLGLDSGEDDFAFVRDLPSEAPWTVMPLLNEPLCLVLPDNHPLSRQQRLTHPQLREIARAPFLSNRRWLEAHCADWPFTPSIADEMMSTHAILALVRAGFGVSFMPASYRLWGSYGLVFVPVETETSTQQLAYPGNLGSPLHRLFLETAQKIAQELTDTVRSPAK